MQFGLNWLPVPFFDLPKELVEQLIAAYFEMCGHIGKDGRKRSNAERGMLGNCEVMLTMLMCREAEMTAGLATDGIIEFAKRLG
jgi:hypothetical protein